MKIQVTNYKNNCKAILTIHVNTNVAQKQS